MTKRRRAGKIRTTRRRDSLQERLDKRDQNQDQEHAANKEKNDKKVKVAKKAGEP
jgi:hypothetical protein